MKPFFFLAILILFSQNCYTPAQQSSSEDNTASEPNYLLGPVTRANLEQVPFNEWFDDGYDSYQPDSVILNGIDFNEIEIITFMGTWCSDSRQEVPRLFKVLDQLNFPEEKMTVIAVDEDKANPSEEIKEWSIEFVPTIILLRNSNETGRIVETPTGSLEKHLQTIISAK